MSALSDYYVTHDRADLESYRWECERDEREYRDSFYDDDENYEED